MTLPSNEELGELMQQFYILLLNAETDFQQGADVRTEAPSQGTPEQSSTSGSKRSNSNLTSLIQAINHLEDTLLYDDVPTDELTHHPPTPDCSDRPSSSASADVTLEIVQDCQRKGAAAIRAHFSEHIRGLIYACRRQLTARPDSSGSGGEHSQRHLNAMVELLGEWKGASL